MSDDWYDMGLALDARVKELREEGRPAEEVARLTAGERTAALRARGLAFSTATQGRGKPGARLAYGTGKSLGGGGK